MNEGGKGLGYPQSYGYATWFIIQKDIELAFAQSIGNSKMASIITASTDEPIA